MGGNNSSREMLFLKSYLPVIANRTDFTDHSNKKRLAVCLGALFISSCLDRYLEGGHVNHRSLFQMMYNFIPFVYHYSALAMLTPSWFTFPRFLILSACICFFALVMTM